MDELTDPAVGHTFVMHLLPEGGVQVREMCRDANPVFIGRRCWGARSWQHGMRKGLGSAAPRQTRFLTGQVLWMPLKTRVCVQNVSIAPVVPGGCCCLQVYQSFIRHFRLHTYLQSHGPLDAAGLQAFIDNLQVIAGAGDTWGC